VQSLNMQLGHGSHPGRVREHNEDYHRIKSFVTPRGILQLTAVADGIGGAVAGEKASKLAIETLTEVIANYTSTMQQGREVIALEKAIERSFTLANRAIHQASLYDPNLSGMGTTLTTMVFFEGRAVLGHVGDSRVFVTRKGEIRQLTEDHSWVAEQVLKGFLTKEEAENHAYRNIITRALGTKPQVVPDVRTVKVQPNDIYLLCTDGLYGLVEAPEFLSEMKGNFDPQASMDYWINLANQRGGPDNITGVVVRIMP
jgi:protein phosphatase